MIMSPIRSLALVFALGVQTAHAQTNNFFDNIFPPLPTEDALCEMTRKAMDKFLQGRENDTIEIPAELKPLGINPMTSKPYVIARCPYTPPEGSSVIMRPAEPAFMGM